MHPFSMAMGAGLVLGLALSAVAENRLATIVADAGDHDRYEAPVSVTLPETINPWGPLRLVEVSGGAERAVPLQVERTGEGARLWFVLDGSTAAGERRRFELREQEPLQRDRVVLRITPTAVEAELGGRPVFTYNHGHVVPPEGVAPAFIRSGYIHPVFSPSGRLVTEDFPSDHLHHKGIWFPWTRTRFEGRSIDFWNLAAEEGTVQFAGFDGVESGPVYGHLRARHESIDLTQPEGGKVALEETWDVRLWGVGGPESGWWAFDLTSGQQAVQSPLELLEYHYGGLGFRGAAEWTDENHVILSSEGRTKADGHATRSRWVAHSGEIDGQWVTVVIMVHPANERFPEPMRIWESGGSFFCYSPVQLGDWTFEPGEVHTFRYRFLVHDGPIDADAAEMAWRHFADPPVATLQEAP